MSGVQFGAVRAEYPQQRAGPAVARVVAPGAAEERGAPRAGPGACTTRVVGASASRSASNGVETCRGWTPALPPPCTRGSAACAPITAREVSESGSRGSTPRLPRSTHPAATARRSRTRGSSAGEGCWAGSTAIAGVPGSSAPTRSASRSSRPTLSSIAAMGTCPSSIARTRPSAQGLSGPGIARSRAARAAGTVERTAPQSETRTPSKPHSSLSGRASSGLSARVVPSTAL